jgi:predicted ATPase
MLIVLDNCEHQARAVAQLADRLLNETSGIHILATSRQPLRAPRECLLRLDPLEFPCASAALSASEALRFPAIQLFVERAHASLDTFELDDVDSPVVAEICRRLDGLPLAIELAAAHVDGFGIRGLLARIDTDMALWTPESNSIRPRHRTLNATLDWSYNLLSEDERTALQRLGILVGTFSLEAAQSVTAGDRLDPEHALEAIASLVGKSLIAVEIGKPEMQYRLLDTTRAYALSKLSRSGEYGVVARHHAMYYRDLLERAGQGHAPQSCTGDAARCSEHLGNVRAALEWSFSATGDPDIGTALAAAAARCMLDASLLLECRHWMEQSLAILDAACLGTRREMEIRAALALSRMFTHGNSEDVRTALTQALNLAEKFEDPFYEIRLVSALHIFMCRRAEFRDSLLLAERGEAVARSIVDPTGNLIADSMLGISHHLIGHQARAQAFCEAALSRPQVSRLGALMSFGYDHRIRTLVALTRTLWLRGYGDRAVQVAYQTLDEAVALDQPVSLCFGLIYTASVMMWVGQQSVAAEIIDRLLVHAEKHSLSPYHAVARCMKAGLELRCGRACVAADSLSECLGILNADHHRILSSVFVGDLAESLAAQGRLHEATAVIDATLALSAQDGPSFHTPELYRIKAQLVSLQPGVAAAEVELWLTRSLELARSQAALAWELRAAMALARLWHEQGRREEARSLLGRAYGQFTEGFATTDLVAARRLVHEIERKGSASAA